MRTPDHRGSPGVYDGSFYDRQRDRSRLAASRILPLVLRLFPVKSMVDFGCGVGTWLAAARELGVRDTAGVEGPWVDRDDLLDPDIDLVTQDLEQPVRLPRRFDLAVSLEVAEHLDPSRATSFVQDLTRTSDQVLFSAAVPGQGGEHHVNEQWQSYWATLFRSCGYRPLDAVRPEVWDDEPVPNHYKQNTLLYVAEDAYERVAAAAKGYRVGPPLVLDLVHPQNYFRVLGERDRPLNFSEGLAVARGLPASFYRAVRRRLPGGSA